MKDDLCYMVFPYLPHSLRQEVNHRVFTTTPTTTATNNLRRHIVSQLLGTTNNRSS
jgi:hypothetical protein